MISPTLHPSFNVRHLGFIFLLAWHLITTTSISFFSLIIEACLSRYPHDILASRVRFDVSSSFCYSVLLSFDSTSCPVACPAYFVCFGRDWSIRFFSLCCVYLHSLRMRSFYACARVVCFYVTLICAKTMRIVTKFVSRNTCEARRILLTDKVLRTCRSVLIHNS